MVPANSEYKNADGQTIKDLFDELRGDTPTIFAVKFDNEECNTENYMNFPNALLIDIDASFTSYS
jgi:hypothetical protein